MDANQQLLLTTRFKIVERWRGWGLPKNTKIPTVPVLYTILLLNFYIRYLYNYFKEEKKYVSDSTRNTTTNYVEFLACTFVTYLANWLEIRIAKSSAKYLAYHTRSDTHCTNEKIPHLDTHKSKIWSQFWISSWRDIYTVLPKPWQKFSKGVGKFALIQEKENKRESGGNGEGVGGR